MYCNHSNFRGTTTHGHSLLIFNEFVLFDTEVWSIFGCGILLIDFFGILIKAMVRFTCFFSGVTEISVIPEKKQMNQTNI